MKHPKDKAKELVEKYYNYVSGWTTISKPHEYPSAQFEGNGMKVGRAKQCAVIAVDEILNSFGLKCDGKLFYTEHKTIEYWQEVKREINNL